MNSFKSGYGQAKADTLRAIADATKLITQEMQGVSARGAAFNPTADQKRVLAAKIDALRWVRTIVKSQKSPKD